MGEVFKARTLIVESILSDPKLQGLSPARAMQGIRTVVVFVEVHLLQEVDEAWPVDSSIDFDGGQRYCRMEHEGIVGGYVILFR